MKNNWQTKKLEEICSFYNGLWKGEKPPFINVGVIRNTNFTKEGILDYSNIAYLDVEKSKFEKRKLLRGDIILEKSGGGPKQPVGRVVLFDKENGDFSFSNFTSVIRIKDKEIVDPNYIKTYLYFFYINGGTEKMQNGATGIRNLDFNLYQGIEIPIPSLSQQKSIVKILDEVFEKIEKAKENTEKNLQNSKELFVSYVNTSFKGLKLDKVIGEVSKNIDSKRKPVTKRDRISGEYPYYGASGIVDYVNNYLFDGEYLLVSEDGANLIARTYPIAFSISGKAWVNNHAHILYFENDFSRKFIEYYLNSIDLKPYVKGMAQPKLTQSSLNNIKVPFPDVAIQIKIVRELDNISNQSRNLFEIYQQKLAHLEELKKSILQKAFSGEL